MLGFVLPFTSVVLGAYDFVRRWGQVGVLTLGLVLLFRAIRRDIWLRGGF